MRRIVLASLVVMGVLVSSVSAQVLMRPTPRPDRTALNEDWYLNRSPIFVSGDYYFPAGAQVFFDANVMVLTGYYGGVPVYADTTLEPHSIVFVPIGRGLLQPYERRRAGDIVGTTGSRAPSFPVQRDAEALLGIPLTDSTWGRPLSMPGLVPAPAPLAPGPDPYVPMRTIPDPALAEPSPLPGHGVVRTARAPNGADGVWILFQGVRWYAAGKAVVFDATNFEQVGSYEGFAVFRSRAGLGDVIYIPSREGLLAPYARR